jgi:hypothetical protein
VSDELRSAALGVTALPEYEPEPPQAYEPPPAPQHEPEPVGAYEPPPAPEHEPEPVHEDQPADPTFETEPFAGTRDEAPEVPVEAEPPAEPSERTYAASAAADWVVGDRPQKSSADAADAGSWLLPELGEADAQVPEAVPVDWTLPARETAADPSDEPVAEPAAWALAVPAAAAAAEAGSEAVATDWVLDGSEGTASGAALTTNGAGTAIPAAARWPWRRRPPGAPAAHGERNLIAAIALLAVVGVAGAAAMKGGDDSAKLGSAPIAATPAVKPKPKPKPHRHAPARPHRKRHAQASKPAPQPATQQPAATTPVRQTTPVVRRPVVTPRPKPTPKPVVSKPKPKPTPTPAPQPDPAGRVPSSDGP